MIYQLLEVNKQDWKLIAYLYLFSKFAVKYVEFLFKYTY